MAIIKAHKKYDNPLEALKSEVSNKPLFSEYDWKQAMDTGRLDQYSMALINSDNINTERFYSDYGLLYADPTTRFNALINETTADRTKTKRQVQQFDPFTGQAIMTKNDKGEDEPLFVEEEISDYEYGKRMIQLQNQIFERNRMIEHAKLTRGEGDGFIDFLGSIAAVPMNLVEGVYLGVHDLGSLIGALIESGYQGRGDTYGDRFLYNLNDNMSHESRTAVEDWMRHFEYNYTFYMDDEGNYNTGGQIAAGAAESIGKMIPGMLVGYGIGNLGGAIAGAVGAAASTVAKVTSITTQVASSLTFYSSVVFAEDVNQQYEYFKSQGFTPPTAQILASSAVKSALQYGVEFGLGRLLGVTGMDKMIFNRSGQGAVKTAMGKTLGQRAAWSFAKDALQEGLEEALQETTDFLVNAFMHNIVNHNFDDVKWDWETVGLSFVMGAISSIGMGGAQILGTKSVKTGNFKTTKSGEIINDEFVAVEENSEKETTEEVGVKETVKVKESQKLGKFASWQFGQDMESYAEAFNELVKAGEKLNTEEGKKQTKAQEQYVVAYEQALASLQLILDLYGEVGREKFAAANEMLRIIKTQIDDGTFDNLTATTAPLLIAGITEEYLQSLGAENAKRIKARIAENGGTKIKSVIKEDETVGEDSVAIAKAMEEINTTRGETFESVIVTDSGRRPLIDDNTLIIPENLLLNGAPTVVIESIAESQMADSLVQGIVAKQHYFKNEMAILRNLYSQWRGIENFTDDEMIFTLIFDPRFFEAVLSVNEKLSSTYVLRLNTLIDSVKNKSGLSNKLLNKKLNECRKRWKDAALDFYANNLKNTPDTFIRSLTKKEQDEFKKKLSAKLQLFNMGRGIIKAPSSVSQKVWDFMARRINNMRVDEAKKTELMSQIKDDNSRIRAEALTYVSDYYDGAFMTLYDGKHFLTKDSFTNEVFNSWLEHVGLFVYQIFDPKYLTEQDIKTMGIESPTENDIIQYRQEQLSNYNPNLSLEYVGGNIVIHATNGEDGFAAAYKNLLAHGPEVITGESFKLGTDKVTRKFATDLKSNDDFLKSLLKSTIVEDYLADWFTVEDVINHPEYLIESVYDIILGQYGAVDRLSVYRYIAQQLATQSKGEKSLITLQDGTIMIGDMSSINDMYINGVEIPKKGSFPLSKFIQSKYATGILGTCKVVIGNYSSPEYVDYDYNDNGDGTYSKVFVNEIHLPANEQSYMKFALAHEMQHALQLEMGMIQGITSNPLDMFSTDDKIAIIRDVLHMAPELFIDLPANRRTPSDSVVQKRVNHYIYFGSGEMQAMGLGATSMMTFYPVRVSRKNGETVITFKNGHKYKAHPKVDPAIAASRIVDSAQELLERSYKTYNIPQAEKSVAKKMRDKGRKMFKVGQYKSTSADFAQEYMYYTFTYDGSLEDFKESKILIVEIEGNRFALRDIGEFNNLINAIKSDISLTNDNVRITAGWAKVKDIKSFSLYSRTYVGKVDVPASYVKNKKHANIDVSQLPKVGIHQQLDVYNSLTGKEFTDELNIKTVLPNVEDLVTFLKDKGFDTVTLGHINNMNELLLTYENNEELQSLLHYYLYEPYGLESDPYIKKALDDAITPKDTFNSILDFKDYGFYHNHENISIEELSNFDLPVIRYQTVGYKNMKNEPFVSVNLVYDEQFDSFLSRAPSYLGSENYKEGVLFGGTIKLKDCRLILPSAKSCEILIPWDKISNLKGIEFAGKCEFTETDDGINFGNIEYKSDNASVFSPRATRLNLNDGQQVGKVQSLNDLKEIFDDAVDEHFRYSTRSYIKNKSELKSFGDKIFAAAQRVNSRHKHNLAQSLSITTSSVRENLRATGIASNESNIWFDETYGLNPFTILHELIHIVTFDALHNKNSESFSKSKIATMILDKVYTQLYEKYCKDANGNEIVWEDRPYYGLRNVSEMVAELVNPNFRRFLAKEKLDKSVYNAIAQMINQESSDLNLMEITSEALEMIFEAPINYTSNSNQSLMTIDELEIEDHKNKAIKRFGLTRNFDTAGFIVNDGNMLEFDSDSRVGFRLQHSKIGDVLEEKGQEAVNRFIQEGNIRIDAVAPGIEISATKKPTPQQLLTMRRFASKSLRDKGRFYIDIINENRELVASIRYDEDDDITSELISLDLEDYYDKGHLPSEATYGYNQNLGSIDDLDYGIYKGLLYKNGKLYQAEPVEFYGVLVLDSTNPEMQKMKDVLKKILNVKTDAEIVSSLREMSINDKAKFDYIMQYLNSTDGAYQHILLGDDFIVCDNKISNFSIDPHYYMSASEVTDAADLNQSEIVETTKTSEPSEPIPFEKVDGTIIDNRKNKTAKFNPNRYAAPTITNYRKDGILREVGPDEIGKEVENSGVHLVLSRKNVDYVYRKFVKRVIYSENYGDKDTYQDVYEYYYPSVTNESRRYALKSEVENTNLKYWSENNKQIQQNPTLRKFIIATTGKDALLDETIMNKIYDRSLTLKDLEAYILQSPENIDAATFNLINEIVYKNDFIESPEMLRKLSLDLGLRMFALYTIIKDHPLVKEGFSKIRNVDELEQLWLNFHQDPKYTERLNKSLTALIEGIPTYKYSEKNNGNSKFDADLFSELSIIKVMKSYTGTPESLSTLIAGAWRNTLRHSYDVEHGHWNTALRHSLGTQGSLDKQTGKIKRTGHETTSNEETNDTEFYALLQMAEETVFDAPSIDNIKEELLNADGSVAKFALQAIGMLGKAKDENSTTIINYFKNYREAIRGLSVNKAYDWWVEFVEKSSVEQLLEIYALADISVDENMFENYTEEIKSQVKRIRPQKQIDNLRGRLKTIKKYLAESDYKNFLKVNGDIFNEDLTFKETAFKKEIDGEYVYKTDEELKPLMLRLEEIKTAVKHHAFTKDNFTSYQKQQSAKIKADLAAVKAMFPSMTNNTISNKTAANKTKVVKEIETYVPVFYEEGDIINSDKKVPKILRDVLSKGLSKQNKTRVQNLSLDDETHLAATIQSLFDDNFTRLMELGEDEVREYLEFFVNHGVMSTDSEASRIAIQMESMLAAYFLARHNRSKESGSPIYDLDENLVEATRKRLTDLATFAGQMLRNERLIKAMLDPNDARAQMMTDELGIELDEESKEKLKKLLQAIQKNDDSYKKVKKDFEESLLRHYKSKKRNIWNKILTFERAMMLSNPGTWFRNVVSNKIVTGGNVAASKIGDKIGEKVGSVFINVLRKNKDKAKAISDLRDDIIVYTKKTKDGDVKIERYQYKLNTKPNDIPKEITDYIKMSFEDTGVIDETVNGLSKYNLDNLDHKSSSDNITDMIARSIAAKIRREEIFATGNQVDSKIAKGTDAMIKFIFDRISDDKYVKKTAKKYFAQVLLEDFNLAKKDNPNLTFTEFVNTPDSKNNRYGIASHVTTAYSKAFNLASADYMRSPNWMSGLERYLRERWGDGKRFFVYKQVFPFLISSWSWCVEAMRYTPVGLLKSINDIAKLENAVANADKLHTEGKSIVHSEFTRYLVKRNLGKGVIGSGAFVLGMVLAGLGWAGIDDDDGKYKLNVLGAKLALDDILASQGITMGIALISNMNDDADFIDVLGMICDQLFKDSVLEDTITTFRHSSGFSDWALREMFDIPSQFIPNLFKSVSAIAHHRGVTYSDNFFISRWQKFCLQMIPVLPENFVGAYTRPNIYTGKIESWWSWDVLQTSLSKFTPIDISYPSMTENELEAVSLGINKSLLKGRYEIDGTNVVIDDEDRLLLNKFYGEQNDKDLTALRNNKVKVTSKTEDGKYKELYYRQMTDKQKKAAIETIMSDNSQLAKIYILTLNGDYKYYATESEYNELRKLGITRNIYRKTDKLKGFVKT